MSYYSSRDYGSRDYGSRDYGSQGYRSRYGDSDSYNSRNDFEKFKEELKEKNIENKKNVLLKKCEDLITRFFDIIKLIDKKIVTDIISKLNKIGNKHIEKIESCNIEETKIIKFLNETFSPELEKIQDLLNMIDDEKNKKNIKLTLKRKIQGHSSYSRESNNEHFKIKIVTIILEGKEGKSEEISKMLLDQAKKNLNTELSSNNNSEIYKLKNKINNLKIKNQNLN